VDDVVERLGCVGALATTLENDKGLYLRASSFQAAAPQVQNLWARGGFNPAETQAIVYLDNSKHRHNLSVTAVNEVQVFARPYSVSDCLYDLFRPQGDEKKIDQIQAELNIQQVVAVPFIVQGEVVGTLIALTANTFADQEIDFLVAFGHQAAAAVQSHYHLTAMEALERVIFKLQARMTAEVDVLQTVVDAVVHELGYQGAMVATLEEGRALPVRAYALEGSNALLGQWEKLAGKSLIGDDAVVYLDDEKYKDNLSVRAVKGLNGGPEGASGRPQNYLTSNNLYDLLRPIAPKAIADLAQTALGIKQVIAVPFFIEDEIVGNLFVASRRPSFSAWEISLLTSFGQQAAAGIRNARLYREAENQRQIAEQFGRMAFSATASVHTLGNHVGAVRTYLHLLSGLAGYSTSQQQEILRNNANMLDRLRRASEMLAKLHEPWRELSDDPVSVNDCLVTALNAVYPQLMEGSHTDNLAEQMGAHVHILLSPHLPPMYTAAEMLTEAFRVVLKNARDAIRETGQVGDLWLTSMLMEDGRIRVTIKDNGEGVPKENIPHIFEMGWTTKEGQGMGFGLFWAKDYMHGLGGQIEVESVWGEGATFHLCLPVNMKQ
jgi:signal transduction histidine kinase